MTTRKMFRDDLDLGACPECTGISIDGGSFDVDGCNIRQELTCADCDCEWFDTWTLSSRTISRARVPAVIVIEFY